MTPTQQRSRRQMREWAYTWRREFADSLAVSSRPQTWRYGTFYAEIRRVVNASSRRKYPDSEALAAAIRCRNRSLGRSAFS